MAACYEVHIIDENELPEGVGWAAAHVGGRCVLFVKPSTNAARLVPLLNQPLPKRVAMPGVGWSALAISSAISLAG